MAHLLEEELFCSVCGKSMGVTECCGRAMELDGEHLFCSACGRERKIPRCCGRNMEIRKRIRNIKKDLFSDPNRVAG